MAAELLVGAKKGRRCPWTMHVLGRSQPQENADICGEYKWVGQDQGYAVYQMPNQNTMVRYDLSGQRWIISRCGSDKVSTSSVAFANDTSGLPHPVNPSLVWHVWNFVEGAFTFDPGIQLVDSPVTVTVVGRSDHRTNFVNGQFHLTGIDHGRPVYTRRMEDGSNLFIRYDGHEGTWLISQTTDGKNRVACANALGALHPGFPGLEWHFLDCEQKAWVIDPAVHTLSAPWLVHVIGRAPEAPNSKINGTYQLAGARDGRPVYVKPGTRSLIRYSAKHDWWLIDADGLKEPSLATRLYQWILSGDPSAAENQCSAFCKARGTDHPGHCMLEWSVWEEASGRHVPDAAVRVTDAPIWLQVYGRHSGREHGNINGSYFMSGTVAGRPAYRQKARLPLSLTWSMRLNRWIFIQMFQENECVAYSENLDEDCPGRTQQQPVWSIYERRRGCYIADKAVGVVVDPAGGQCFLHDPCINTEELGPCVKRLDHGGNVAPTAKRRRLCSGAVGAGPELHEYPADASKSIQRTSPGITSRIAALFGG